MSNSKPYNSAKFDNEEKFVKIYCKLFVIQHFLWPHMNGASCRTSMLSDARLWLSRRTYVCYRRDDLYIYIYILSIALVINLILFEQLFSFISSPIYYVSMKVYHWLRINKDRSSLTISNWEPFVRYLNSSANTVMFTNCGIYIDWLMVGTKLLCLSLHFSNILSRKSYR